VAHLLYLAYKDCNNTQLSQVSRDSFKCNKIRKRARNMLHLDFFIKILSNLISFKVIINVLVFQIINTMSY